MNIREYNKYHQEMYDALDKPIGVGDTVVANNYYKASVHIGKVSHFTESGRVAIKTSTVYGKTRYEYFIYRLPFTIIVIKKSRKKKDYDNLHL
jgi:hypothetical protein